MPGNKEFALYLKNKRFAKGYSKLKDLADASGITSASLSRIENAKQDPTPELLKKLSSALNTSLEELMIRAGYLEPRKDEITINVLDDILNSLSKDELMELLLKIPEIIKSKKK